MTKVLMHEHDARALLPAYQKRVRELIETGYAAPEDRAKAVADFSKGIGDTAAAAAAAAPK